MEAEAFLGLEAVATQLAHAGPLLLVSRFVAAEMRFQVEPPFADFALESLLILMDGLDVQVAAGLRTEGFGAEGTNEEVFVAVLDLVVSFQFPRVSEPTPALWARDLPVHVSSLVTGQVDEEFAVEREELVAVQALVGLRLEMILRVGDKIFEALGRRLVVAKQLFDIVFVDRQMIQQLDVALELFEAGTALLLAFHFLRRKLAAILVVLDQNVLAKRASVVEGNLAMLTSQAFLVVPADVVLKASLVPEPREALSA